MRNCVLRWSWLLGALALLAGGCGKPAMVADDAILMDHRPTQLDAHIGREDLFDLHGTIHNITVSFFVNGRKIGWDKVDEDGRAFALYEDGDEYATSFRASSRYRGRTLESTGRIYHWRGTRVIVAVDVDYVIAQTNYVRLLFGKHIPVSPPFPNAREVLVGLSNDYQLLYLTARPRVMLPRTRQWLEYYRFPAGPIVVSDHFHNVLHQLEWKQDALKQLHAQYPSLLISVGNRQLDVQSAVSNHILPLTLQTVEHDVKANAGDVLLEDWLAIGEFFRVNRDTLAYPGRLNPALHGELTLLRPLGKVGGGYWYETLRLGPNDQTDAVSAERR